MSKEREELRAAVQGLGGKLAHITATLHPAGEVSATAKAFLAVGQAFTELGEALAGWDDALDRLKESG